MNSLQKGLIFHAPLNERDGYQDLVSETVGTATAVYNVLDRQGSGRRWFDFDASTDYVTTSSSAVEIGSGDYSIILRLKLNTKGRYILARHTAAEKGYFMYTNATTGYPVFALHNSSQVDITRSTNICDGEWHNVAIVLSRSGNGTVYVDGVAGTPIDISSQAGDMSVSESLFIGSSRNGALSIDGSIMMCRVFNYSLSAQQIANYSKPEYPIEWVDRGINGEMITQQTDRDFSGANNWGSDGSIGFNSSGDLSLSASAQGQYAKLPVVNSSLEVGRTYTLSFDAANVTGTWLPYINIGVQYLGSTITTSGRKTYTFTATTTGGISFFANGVATGDFDNFTLVKYGCVLDLTSSGLAKRTTLAYNTGYWSDLTNTLEATVSGATAVIPPTSCLGATYFNGTTSKIIYTDQPNIQNIFDSGGSVSFWINPLSNTDAMVISKNVWYIEYSNSSQKLRFVQQWPTGGYTISALNTTIPINTWAHICVNYNNSAASNVAEYYINGVRDTNVTFTNVGSGTRLTDSGYSLYIGSYDSSSYWYNGLISNVIAYTQSLQLDQIKLLWELGR